ncbi:MAG: hypothetical protein A2W31_15310 [Planctomycetes bacterium RBG_16_64_10]|nr:MAG: hypothetical protein A2W31_15310 [Planctomycetes bacterium RBG_16_64_10]
MAGGAVGLGLVALALTSCSTPKPAGPSYAEALAIYNQEVLALDRLREQQDQLKLALVEPEPSNLQVAEQLLGSTAEMQKELIGVLQDVGDPGGTLKEGETDQKQKDLIGAVTRQFDEAKQKEQQEAAAWQQKKLQIEAQIADLDKAIAAQQQRVDRAKADRDAAEAARS